MKGLKGLKGLAGHHVNGMDLETCIDKYRTDITRTYLVFRSQVQTNPSFGESQITEIQQWFESIRKADLLAHDSYNDTQVASPSAPKTPDFFTRTRSGKLD